MASQTSYSIYVRFRGKRLALLKHIRSLDTARTALRALRADRFHDADQVFLVNDQTKEAVNDVEREPATPASPEREPTASAELAAEYDRETLPLLDEELERAALPDVGNELAGAELPDLDEVHERKAAEAELTTAALGEDRPPSTEEPLDIDLRARDSEAAAADETRGDEPDPLEFEANTDPPVIRLRRAMAAARTARARHDAALSAVLQLQPNSVIDEREIRRLEASARAASSLSARALAQLENVIALLDRRGP